jgi:hypothetical protein
MVIWIEQLEVVIVGIVITGRKSHQVVWPVGTNVVEEPAASSFGIRVSNVGRDGANIRSWGQEPR